MHHNIYGGAKMNELKKLRNEKKLTQQQVADLVGVSLRSYKSYEKLCLIFIKKTNTKFDINHSLISNNLLNPRSKSLIKFNRFIRK